MFQLKVLCPLVLQELVRLIESSQVVVVSGETGCGKTTQVTQFILDDYIERDMGSLCRVVCTQPRRISAISVSLKCGHSQSVSQQIKILMFEMYESCLLRMLKP